MLNHPLSLLSEDLFGYIVDRVAELPSPNKYLYSLSIADRVFTPFCQAHIFKVLNFGYGYADTLPRHLPEISKILNNKPSFANSVRVVSFDSPDSSLFDNLTFISVFQHLAKSLRPPHQLHLFSSFLIEGDEDSIHITGRLMQTFFSQTLTVLHLTHCGKVPLTIFLVCPRLREILLDGVRAIERSGIKYPDEQFSVREPPALEYLDYRESESLVKQMITPPPRFHTAVVFLSKLRILTLCPHEEEEMACLQPILDVAWDTLEELYLTRLPKHDISDHLSLVGLVNLRNLSSLHVFALDAIIKCDTQKPAVLHDINLVLDTIPTPNEVRSLTFNFTVSDKRPFLGCLEEDWAGLCDQVVRISGGKHVKLNISLSVSRLRYPHTYRGSCELSERIMERIRPLSKYSNILLVQERKEVYPIPDYFATM